jgi:hypothetical protein
MRTVTYTIVLEIPEGCDFEAVTSTFEQYISDFNEASRNEWPLGAPEANTKTIEV